MEKEQSKIGAFFLRMADKVSYGMGTPTNILIWMGLVGMWFAYGIFFVPNWFTSNSWNFPLNTITTLAELYIGFLVAASSNRSERELKRMIKQIITEENKIEDHLKLK